MELTAFYNMIATVFFVLVGLCVGSFLNVVIYRLPNKMSLATPPSHCTACGYQLSWYDNIPVFSYLFLGGRCRKCKTRISPRYICVELANMLLWLLCALSFGFSGWREIVMTVSAALACSVCICIAAIDWEHKIIFDRFQIMMLVLAVAFMIADAESSVISNVITAVAAFAILFLVGMLISRKVGQEALGGGDVKFSFVSALFLGWKRAILMWILASVSALIAIAIIKARAKSREEKTACEEAPEDEAAGDTAYPFGPFLAFGFIVALLFGAKIISAYFGLFGIAF